MSNPHAKITKDLGFLGVLSNGPNENSVSPNSGKRVTRADVSAVGLPAIDKS